MRLLITGGCGFIASNFIMYMMKHYPGYYFLNLDLLTNSGNPDNLQSVSRNKNYKFVKGDICNFDLIDHLVESQKIDAVINFASENAVNRNSYNSQAVVNTNVLGTQVLLDIARKHKLKKFIQISTDEVYGKLGLDERFTEESGILPKSPYASSKAAADMLVKSYFYTYNTPTTIARCSNTFGPYQFPDKFIPGVILIALQDRPIKVYGDGMYTRNWIYIEDNCQALDFILHRGKSGETYNVGNHTGKLNLEVIQAILKEIGKPDNFIVHLKDRRENQRNCIVDNSKILTELGWNPSHTFEDGLTKTVEWYKENKNWSSRILSGDYKKFT